MKNISNTSINSFDVKRDWIILSLYFITAIIAIIGNIYVCLVIYYKKKLRSTTYILVLNIAISDIIGGLVIPMQWLFCSTYTLDSGDFGKVVCALISVFLFNLRLTSVWIRA